MGQGPRKLWHQGLILEKQEQLKGGEGVGMRAGPESELRVSSSGLSGWVVWKGAAKRDARGRELGLEG